MDGLMDGRMDGRTDGRTDEFLDRQMGQEQLRKARLSEQALGLRLNRQAIHVHIRALVTLTYIS